MWLIPGYAQGAISLDLRQPPTVVVGTPFNVEVDLIVTGGPGDPASICGWQYGLLYDSATLELLNVIDNHFFSQSGNPDGRAAFGCSLPVPVCQTLEAPGIFGAFDFTLTTPVNPPFPPPVRATATLTFKALQVGSTQILPNPAATNSLSDCEASDFAVTSFVNPPISIVSQPSVPALSTSGVVIFGLLLVASAVLFMRRRHNRG
jgi:hypothetical protein